MSHPRSSAPVRRRRTRFARDRRGFALPTALLIIAVLSALGAAALAISGSEGRAASAQLSQVQALAFARSGIERYLANIAALGASSTPPAAHDSSRIAFSGGYSDVVVSQVRAATATQGAEYLIRSHGVKTDPTGALTIAERTVAQYARWQEPTMKVLAALTSISGVVKGDALGTVDGTDACGVGASVAGIAVPAGQIVSQGPGPSISSGSPSVLSIGAQASADGLLGVDWNAIANGLATGGLSSNVDLSTDVWPGGSDFGDQSYWPTIVAPGSITMSDYGRGLLVVGGDLTVPAGTTFRGVILVGGTMRALGAATIQGAVVTGLALAPGSAAAPTDLGLGAATYRYDSCAISGALQRYRGLAPFRNATVDNWPTY